MIQGATYFLAALAALITAAGGAYTIYRKLGPETKVIQIGGAGQLSEMSLNFADAVGKDNADLRADIEDIRSRLDEMAVELRAERAEKIAVKRENVELRARVDELEREVASLKANGS